MDFSEDRPRAGCGTGSLSISLALQGAEVYGSDISSAMVRSSSGSSVLPATLMSHRLNPVSATPDAVKVQCYGSELRGSSEGFIPVNKAL